ncbi:MAG: DNA-formamidopyrimidine glycosylase [Deltaproteobacteria bacterium RIFOXYA12_FULL_58_15]|nr:MAG: DNA-formamidopyrimidine glycosylase [Deltaproteobacteria bacterium RIFOXYA12_FULL_58_15]OGR09483.1 MAG: DNA-formamidopyrimidine glycosylase [Deltaproteobacteria bacterium RIFOXYB12_FULL_58_9]
MPELPEVETVRRGLEAQLVGRRVDEVVVRDRRLRLPVPSGKLRRLIAGQRVLGARRRGKYVLLDFDGGAVLMVHLGMSGRLTFAKAGVPYAKHDHVVFELDGGRELRFNDPRRFGLVDAFARSDEPKHPRLANLGVEPLAVEFNANMMHKLSRGSTRAVKSFIMDASVVVGVGNIYACEALFAAQIPPSLSVGRLSKVRWQRLVDAVRGTLVDAIARGGTTLRDFANPAGEAGYFATDLRAYGREGEACVRCGRRIRRIVQGGRSTFYCAHCQR